MVKKNYSVTLENDIVEKVKDKLQRDKLSPLINDLLIKWLGEKNNEII
jgi:hypothetical protein